MEKDHFLTPEKGITPIDDNSTSLDELLEMLTDSRKNADEITRLAKAQEIDYNFTIAVSKVRAIVSCDVCNTQRYIFSMRTTDGSKIPSERQACELDRWTESGCACGN